MTLTILTAILILLGFSLVALIFHSVNRYKEIKSKIDEHEEKIISEMRSILREHLK